MHNIPLYSLLACDKMCKKSQKFKYGLDSASVLKLLTLFRHFCHMLLIILRLINEDNEEGSDEDNEPVEDDEHDGDHAAADSLDHQVDILPPSLLFLGNAEGFRNISWELEINEYSH